MVLRLSGELAEHLVDTAELRDTHVELDRLVHTLPAGPRQRETGPTGGCSTCSTPRPQRAALVPLIDALHARMRAEKVMDFGSQMSAAARLAATPPAGRGGSCGERYRVVLLDEYQDTGHAQRIALSALFGGGADDEPGADRGGRSDPVHLRLARRLGDQPAAVHHRLPARRRQPRRPPASCAPAGATRRGCCTWPTRSPPRPAGARWRCARCAPRPGAEPGTVRVRAAHRRRRRTGLDGRPHRRPLRRRRAARAASRPPPRCWCAATPTPARSPQALTARGVPVEVVGLAGLLSIPEVAQTGVDAAAGRRPDRRCGGHGGADRAALAPRRRATWPRCGAARWCSTAQRHRGGRRLPSRSSPRRRRRRGRQPGRRAGRSRARRRPTRRRATGASPHWPRNWCGCAAFWATRVTDLVAEVRRVLGRRRRGACGPPVDAGTGTEHLDRFADVVAGYTERAGRRRRRPAGLPRRRRGGGERPGPRRGRRGRRAGADPDRARRQGPGVADRGGAAPVSARVFPSTGMSRTWLNDAGDLPPLLRGDSASTAGCTACRCWTPPRSTTARRSTTSSTPTAISWRSRRIDEERRLLYVALTRAEDTLLLSGHHWGAGRVHPARAVGVPAARSRTSSRPPAAASHASGALGARTRRWGAEPVAGEHRRSAVAGRPAARSPRRRRARRAPGGRRDGRCGPHGRPTILDGWIADVDALLAERARAAAAAPRSRCPVSCRSAPWSTSTATADAAARRLTRRLPARPDPHAILGTAFHDWVQRFYGAERLFDLDDLPGAGDAADRRRRAARRPAGGVHRLARGRPAPRSTWRCPSRWRSARRSCAAASTPCSPTPTAASPSSTGRPASRPPTRRPAGTPRCSWRSTGWRGRGWPAARSQQVRAAFHYVRSGRTVTPEALPGPRELAALLSPEAERCA